MKMVVGLGNPGARYAETRHNIGFLVVDQLADRYAVARPRCKFRALLAEARVGDETVWLLQPQTYMNCSGEAVAAAVRFYQIDLADLLVVCDDLSLPLGRLRFRRKGSDGGHKGLRSIITCLGTAEFPRLRLGIGGPDELAMAAIEYVLSPFRDDEIEVLNQTLQRAAAGAEKWIREGIEAAMNQFNG